MKRILCILAIVLFFCVGGSARAKYSDYVQVGGKSVKTSSVLTYLLMETYPNSTVTVYKAGTTNLATIYSNSSGSPKSNPFMADSKAYYEFYADNGFYDIKYSGTGISLAFTRTYIALSDTSESYDPLSFGAKCNNSSGSETADTAAFTAIKTLIGSTQTTTKIPKLGPCKLNTFTFPSNMNLDFSSSGGILSVTGQTVTYNSDQIGLPTIQRFYNVGSGLGAVDFSTNLSILEYHLKWFGPKGDWNGSTGTDDTIPINAFLATVPNGRTARLDYGKYKHTGLTVDHKFQVTYIGNDTEIGYSDPSMRAEFYYLGSNGGTALLLNNVYSCAFKDFSSYAAGSSSLSTSIGAANNLYLTFTTGGAPGLSSNNLLEGIMVLSYNARADYIGLKIGNANLSNNEYHRIIRCMFFGVEQSSILNNTGTGITIEHFNVKQIILINNNFSNLAKGVNAVGSFQAQGNQFGNNKVCWYLTGALDAIYIIGDDAENNYQYIGGSSVNAPIKVIAARLGNIRTDAGAGMSQSEAVISIPAGIGRFYFDGIAVDFNGGIIPPYLFASEVGQGLTPIEIKGLIFGGNQGGQLSDIALGLNTLAPILDKPKDNQVGNSVTTVAHDLIQSTGSFSNGISTFWQGPGDGAYNSGNRYSIASDYDTQLFGEGLEVVGVSTPNPIKAKVIGVTGATQYNFWILAKDANGNQTLKSNTGNYASVSNANATLSGSNYIHLTWTAIPRAATYEVYQSSNADPNGQARLVAAGIITNSYDVIANPVGAYSVNTTLIPLNWNTTTRTIAHNPFQFLSVTFANLGKPAPVNGDTVYCSDCKNIVDDGAVAGAVCVNSGTGARALRQNGKWICN